MATIISSQFISDKRRPSRLRSASSVTDERFVVAPPKTRGIYNTQQPPKTSKTHRILLHGNNSSLPVSFPMFPRSWPLGEGVGRGAGSRRTNADCDPSHAVHWQLLVRLAHRVGESGTTTQSLIVRTFFAWHDTLTWQWSRVQPRTLVVGSRSCTARPLARRHRKNKYAFDDTWTYEKKAPISSTCKNDVPFIRPEFNKV